jgi:hypothetical protein
MACRAWVTSPGQPFLLQSRSWGCAEMSLRVSLLGLISILAMACQSCICGSLPFSVDTPPLILAPAQYAEVRDGRGRFREIYCAVREDHGAALPYDRPCEEVIWSLSNEPTGSGRPVWLGPARLKLRILVASGIYSECVLLCLDTPGTIRIPLGRPPGERPVQQYAQCPADQKCASGHGLSA